MPRRALNLAAASMPLLALASRVAVAEGTLRYHVPYVCNGERIVVTRCRSDSDQPGFPATQPGSDYCAVVYPDRPLRNGITVETAELRAAVLSKLDACNGAHPNAPVPEAVPPSSSAAARAKALTDQGLAYEDQKQYDAALRAFQGAIDLKPDAASLATAYYHEGLIYAYGLKQSQNALAPLQAALRLTPDDADADRVLGWALIDLKQYADGRDVLQRAVRLKPDDAGAQYWLGYAYLVLRALPSAEAAFREALRVNPDNASTLYLLGTTYVGMGNDQAALQIYQKLQTLDQDEAGRLHDLINEVQADANKAPAAQSPNAAGDTCAQDLLAQGDKYRKSGEHAKAVGAYNQVIALVPPRSELAADAHYGLGTMALDQKDYRGAIPDLLIAQRLRPGEPEFQVELGDALLMVDSIPQAIPHLKEAIRLQPDFVYAYQMLGMAYQLSDDKANALQVYEKLKPLDAQVAADFYEEIQKMKPVKAAAGGLP